MVHPNEEQPEQQSEAEPQQQLQVQAVVTQPATEHALPIFRVVGDFQIAQHDTRAVVTTSGIEGRARIDRREINTDIGADLGWIQTMFSARLQADYYTALGVYVESRVQVTNRPLIDGNDNDDVWYGNPTRFVVGEPVIGTIFYDSPQFATPLTSPQGGRLTRFSASWVFGCWLAVRTQNERVKFLYHQDWTASFHAEHRNGVTQLSSEDLTLRDAGPGPGTLIPLMDGPAASTFLDSPGVWSALDDERLHEDGLDLT
jgi:hypothetical protein